jgi:hypothetical protein
MGERSCTYRFLEGKPVGTRPLGRHRHNREDNIKMDHQELAWGGGGGMEWIDLSQNRDVRRTFMNVIMNHLFP